MPARDGGLCRIRLMGGELSSAAAHAIAHAAAHYGSGVIEATNRANLQLRGIRDDAHEALVALLLDAGLGPATPGADDIRNLLLSPVAYDGTRSLAARIVAEMQRDVRLHALSPKFALLLDGGEHLAMLDHPHDIWLAALDGGARFAFGLAGCPPIAPDDAPAIGSVERSQAVPLVLALLQAFLDLAAPEDARMRDLLDAVPVERVLASLDVPFIRDAQAWRRTPADPALRLGAHAQAENSLLHVGAQPPLGRLSVSSLHALAELAVTQGSSVLRMTPWQSVLLPDVEAAHAQFVLDTMHALGFATDPDQPLARVIACAGSPGCARSPADTKADALRLAERLPSNAGEVHLSGCARSCAAARPIATTLVAVAPGRYDLFQQAAQPDTESRCIARNITIEEAAAWLARSTADA
ncbi:precorrin-3B synthase [Caballeronia arationis]|uniref:precorrin-3B synthase n=1 Tax=Caballeronia arationis TaxID=1777142 RepID=UPI001F2CFC1C|nr:precorrin-3B synthase [Caballeronia arationis]